MKIHFLALIISLLVISVQAENEHRWPSFNSLTAHCSIHVKFKFTDEEEDKSSEFIRNKSCGDTIQALKWAL